METINKLQFKHHNEIFTGETLDEARGKVLTYFREQWYITEAFNDPNSNYRSMYAEPTVFRYAAAGDEANPHIILLIGAKTNNNSDQTDNRFCIIDIDKTEQEIEDLREEIEKVIKSLTLTVFDTKTLDLSVEKTEDGTFLSGDVKTADTHVFELDGEELNKRNNLMIGDGDAKGPEGLFLYIDLTYDEENDRYTFLVSQEDGTLKKVILPNNYLVSGEYDITDEAIHLHMKDGEEIVVDCKELILEWTVEGEGSNTPIVLTRERVDYDPEGHHNHEDILRADIRVAEELPNNILDRTTDGRYLYVKGTADNIRYSDEMTVKEAIDSKDDRISTSEGNLIYRREDGIYAHTMLKYNQAENKIGFEYTDGDGELNFVEYQLNSVKLLEDITYDPVNEMIVIRYIDAQGEYQRVEIPVKDIIEEWDVNNEYHNVNLVKQRSEGQGKDLLSADVKIHEGDNNILEDKGYTLYVNGISDNIKYDVTGDTTVKNVLDTLSAASVSVNTRLDEEIARSESEDTKIEDTIGSGFSTDAHETVTYKFDELQTQINSEADKLQDEIDRSTSADTIHDGRLDAIDAEIGDGFGPRNTVRDEFTKEKAEREASDNFLSGTIETLSANTEGRLKSVVNNDHSIDVDNTDAVNPVIKVNLSEEVEDGKPNIIKLNANGLYAGVDLSYEETANKLIFKTTNATKEIQLESMSSIISIEYNPSKEAIVITYMTNGHEIKTVEIPVGDLIREWKPSENTDGAIKLTLTEAPSGTTGKDILYGEVLISAHEDNILVNDTGALYVSNSGIIANAAAIDVLEGRMDTAEANIDALQDGLREETSARTLADAALDAKIEQETEERIADVNEEQARAEARELELTRKIDADVLAEKNRAVSAETILRTAIGDETTRATSEEARIETKLDNEIARSIAKDDVLNDKIDAEAARAAIAESTLDNKIDAEERRATGEELGLKTSLTAEITRATSAETALRTADSVLTTNLANEVARATAAEAAIQAQVDANKLEFHDTTTIDLERSGENPSQVVGHVKIATSNNNIIRVDESAYGIYASVDLTYDSGTNVLTFTASDGTNKKIELSSGSVIHRAWFDPSTEELVLEFVNPDGSFYEVKIPVGSLFNQWDVDNENSKGIKLIKTPGTGSGSTDLLSAEAKISQADDNILTLKDNHLYVSGSGVTKALADTETISGNLETLRTAVNGTSEGYTYPAHLTSHIISAATSYDEADMLLDEAFYNMIDKWFLLGFETCTTHTGVKEVAQNRHMFVDVRMSHGNKATGMTDEELSMTSMDDKYFSDTNVLRYINVSETRDHQHLDPDNGYNGMYLSNYWDCGKYYQTATEGAEIADMVAEGFEVYNTNYKTDEDGSASDYDYNNNVRQS